MRTGGSAYPINIWCLGNTAAEINGRSIPEWRPTKSLILLYYLLDRCNRPVDRATLTDTLWPDGNARAPETSLKVAVHGLRRMLCGAHGTAASADTSNGARPGSLLAIETHSSGYMLRAEDIWYDVAEFERNIAEASRLESGKAKAEALSRRRHAIHLYRGDFFAGASGDWILRRRQALANRYLHALMCLAEADLSAHRYHACISLCLKALNKDPCCERAYQILMLCHARIGQIGGVHAWHDLCRQTLSTRLDIAPSPQTERLFHQLHACPFTG